MSKTLKELLKRALTTTLIISSITGFSACKTNVTQYPVNTPDTKNNITTTAEKQPETKLPVSTESPTSPETQEDIVAKYYSSREQVKEISQALGAKSDLLYRLAFDNKTMSQTIRRMEHNMGKPLKVAINPNMSEKAGKIAIEQLDKIFDAIGSVNKYYKYEVVDYTEDGQYDIEFRNKKLPFNGIVHYLDDTYRNGCAYNNQSIVYIDEEAISNSNTADNETLLKKTLLHESLHVFGFADVYSDQINHIDGTTMLETGAIPSNKFAYTNLTPNDYKNLVSLYAEPSKDLNKDIEKFKTLADKYTKNYYKQWALENFTKEAMPIQGIQNGRYTFTKNIYTDLSTKTREDHTFYLDINGDNYNLTIYNSKGELKETTSGTIKYMNIGASEKTGGKTIHNAIAVIEGLKCKRIYDDIYNDADYETVYSNIVLYNSNGKFVLKSTNGIINKANLEFQPPEQNLER